MTCGSTVKYVRKWPSLVEVGRSKASGQRELLRIIIIIILR
jgi:hypothetical protein